MEEKPPTPTASPGTASQKGTASVVLQQIDERLWEEVNEANEVLEWAVSSGKDIQKEIILQIKNGQALLSKQNVNYSERAEFEHAYAQLTKAVAPVTFSTIRATTDKYGNESCLAPVHLFISRYRKLLRNGKPPIHISRARIWSRMLWIWTILFFIFILFGEHLHEYLKEYPASGQTPSSPDSKQGIEWSRLSYWLKEIAPFCYGALGASAYLLRSCHKHIHERSFDPKRLPEYYNRLLLGFLSGGAILLYMKPGTGSVTVGAEGLAFLGGYSTDFFFTYIERIIEAITPKSSEAPSAPSTPPAPPALPTSSTPPTPSVPQAPSGLSSPSTSPGP